jgi:hypothetical protein
MGKLTKPALLLAAMALFLSGATVLSGCGDGATRREPTSTPTREVPPAVRDAMALLAEPDLMQLTAAERDQIKSALREALGSVGKVHTSSTLDEQDIVFGPDGRVAMMRVFGTAEHQLPDYVTPEISPSETIDVYDGPPARFCDGREDPGLVMRVEYMFAFDQWQVAATAILPAAMPLEQLFSRIDLSNAKDAGFSDDQGSRLRGFIVPSSQPGDPEATLTVWVDLENGLISKLETTVPGVPGYSYPYTFNYDTPFEIKIPSELAAPDCVPVESGG